MLRPLFLLLGLAPLLLVAQRATPRVQLDRLVADNPVFASGHTGFSLYDLATEQTVYSYQADRYFVPASNVKLLTFYVAHRILDRSLPAIYYRRQADRVDIWGTGYPLLLHPAFYGYDELAPWLARQQLPIVVQQPENDTPPRYGAGWSWDDFDYGYVYERSGLPIYGNRLYLDLDETVTPVADALLGAPPEVARSIVQDARQERTIRRAEETNSFTVNESIYDRRNFPLQRALRTSAAFTLRQLQQAFPDQTISGGRQPRPTLTDLSAHRVAFPDTLYRRLLQDSDNYLAEQLILQSAAARYGTFDESTLFDYATDTLFAGIGLGRLRFADGSGLSRYNLVTPNQFVQVLAALDREVGRERLLSLLPTGGKTGTLKRRFDGAAEPYVWAKTGSLSGVLCVSGLLRTRSGRWLAFSFLHNNVMGRTSDYYREMERALGWVYESL
ncbi:D-alanyl-D-alanine carboxypeptidase DacC [Neolewinella maritima]|uniref:D-alanyl-D-alanine carboxypeptidase DacC n=1 Tax=Neolewinella maritima TaxID=1383882 RepID=A0ABN8F742_9BACT|nr:D-alanyl-D-alanine carboxypeptidase/D-alanyl-D-alanine-endopeptidase [Neolewinella maritima]CAH1001020.1 D-alanyl-D-alanine carboxypeptidase DacC [Neolewinella maritima]